MLFLVEAPLVLSGLLAQVVAVLLEGLVRGCGDESGLLEALLSARVVVKTDGLFRVARQSPTVLCRLPHHVYPFGRDDIVCERTRPPCRRRPNNPLGFPSRVSPQARLRRTLRRHCDLECGLSRWIANAH